MADEEDDRQQAQALIAQLQVATPAATIPCSGWA
jgi:hypothetical protein